MIDIINKIFWAIATSLIIFSSIYFTIKLNFVQFHLREMITSLFKKSKSKKKGISPFQTLMISLAGRIGVGSIAGVSLAIYLGGVGSIFWMWVIGILSAVNTFSETVLGNIYKEKDCGNIYKGGPSYYIKKGIKNKFLGSLYAIIILVSYIGGFISIQSNTITKSFIEIVDINPLIVGIVITSFTATIIFGGIKKIANFTSGLVPFMTFFYLMIAFYITIINIKLIPGIFLEIVVNAFNFKSIITGFIPVFIIGVQRGIFSNESGLGTGSIASSSTNDNNPTRQGYIQMLGIYVTTLFICTATAIVILTSNYKELILSDVNGIEITQHAFRYHLGKLGSFILFISILLFSFSTVLTGYYYGEVSIKYFINKIKPLYLNLFKVATLTSLFLGSIIPATFIWDIVDMMVAFLAIINIYALIKLKDKIKHELDCYRSKKMIK